MREESITVFPDDPGPQANDLIGSRGMISVGDCLISYSGVFCGVILGISLFTFMPKYAAIVNVKLNLWIWFFDFNLGGHKVHLTTVAAFRLTYATVQYIFYKVAQATPNIFHFLINKSPAITFDSWLSKNDI